MGDRGGLLAVVAAFALLATPARAEIITARTAQQVVEEEMTVEAALAKLRARGVATGRARVDERPAPKEPWWYALSAVGVRIALRS